METTSNLSYKVTENNGGGISLWVFDDGKGNQFAHTSYEYHPASLLEDIRALYSADNSVTDWDGNDLIAIKAYRHSNITPDQSDDEIFDADGNIIPIDIDDLYDNDDTTSLIANGDDTSLTIYPHGLGFAGTECFDDLLAPYKDEHGYIEYDEINFDMRILTGVIK